MLIFVTGYVSLSSGLLFQRVHRFVFGVFFAVSTPTISGATGSGPPNPLGSWAAPPTPGRLRQPLAGSAPWEYFSAGFCATHRKSSAQAAPSQWQQLWLPLAPFKDVRKSGLGALRRDEEATGSLVAVVYAPAE